MQNKDILHIANLVKIKLTEEEVEFLKQDVEDFENKMQDMLKINTESIEPMITTCEKENNLRDDIEKNDELLTQEEVISQASNQENQIKTIKTI